MYPVPGVSYCPHPPKFIEFTKSINAVLTIELLIPFATTQLLEVRGAILSPRSDDAEKMKHNQARIQKLTLGVTLPQDLSHDFWHRPGLDFSGIQSDETFLLEVTTFSDDVGQAYENAMITLSVRLELLRRLVHYAAPSPQYYLNVTLSEIKDQLQKLVVLGERKRPGKESGKVIDMATSLSQAYTCASGPHSPTNDHIRWGKLLQKLTEFMDTYPRYRALLLHYIVPSPPFPRGTCPYSWARSPTAPSPCLRLLFVSPFLWIVLIRRSFKLD